MDRPHQDTQWTETAEELARLFETEKDERRRQRLLALWHLRRGSRLETAAEAAGVSARTVLRWLRLYRREGLEPLLSHVPGHQAKGRPARLTAAQVTELRARAENGAFRTVSDAVAWVSATWGVDYTYQGMYALLSRRPRSRRANPADESAPGPHASATDEPP